MLTRLIPRLFILRKSQLPLFDPHHVAYVRHSKSGAISNIKAKGVPRPEEQPALDFTARPTPPPEPQKVLVNRQEPRTVDHKQLIATGKAICDRLELTDRGAWEGRMAVVEYFSENNNQVDCKKRAKRVCRTNTSRMMQATKDQEFELVLFYRLAGAKAIPSLKYVRGIAPDAESQRAHKAYDEIWLAKQSSAEAVWHEAAHHIEESHKELGRAAKRFLKARQQKDRFKNPLTAKLRDLVPGSNYRIDEFAVVDKFPNPYTGKVYNHDNHTTEIISMGVAALNSTDKFRQLRDQDLEHLHFTIGMLHYLNHKQGNGLLKSELFLLLKSKGNPNHGKTGRFASAPAVQIDTPLDMRNMDDNAFRAEAKRRTRERYDGVTVTIQRHHVDVLIPWSGIKHAFNHGMSRNESIAAMHIGELLEQSKHAFTEPDRHNRNTILGYHNYKVGTKIDGKEMEIMLQVSEQHDGQRYYDHYEIEHPAGQSGKLEKSEAHSSRITGCSVLIGFTISPASTNINKSLPELYLLKSAVLHRQPTGQTVGLQLPNQHIDGFLTSMSDTLGSKVAATRRIGQVFHDVGLVAGRNHTKAVPVEIFGLEVNSRGQSHNTLQKSELPSTSIKPQA